jgi:DinB family protein
VDHVKSLRQHVINLLTKGEAHADLRSVLKNFPAKLRGRKPKDAPHTPWQLLEHMRLGQWDILRFIVDADHVSPKWPEGYWPKTDKPRDAKTWEKSVQQFFRDLNAISKLVSNPKRDLLAPIPHDTGQTLLREALLLADHNAYHLGQIVMVRRTLEKK